MARDNDFEDDDFRPRKKKGKGFWTMNRIILLVVFCGGLVLGAVFTHYFVEPTLGSTVSLENQDLITRNTALDSLNDQYYSCLQTFGIDPQTCTR